MKKTIILSIAAMFLCPQFAFAQFVGMQSGKSSSSAKLSSSSSSFDDKSSFHICYLPAKFVSKSDDDSESETARGFNIGWDNITQLGFTSLLFEYGLSLDMAFQSDKLSKSSYSYESTTTLLDLRVPFSLSYAFNIPGTSVGLMPLAGLDLGAFLLGSNKYKYTSGSTTNNETTNIFDSSNKYKRFIFDFHVGARIVFSEKFFLEYRYEGPITKLYSEGGYNITFRRHNVGFGWLF